MHVSKFNKYNILIVCFYYFGLTQTSSLWLEEFLCLFATKDMILTFNTTLNPWNCLLLKGHVWYEGIQTLQLGKGKSMDFAQTHSLAPKKLMNFMVFPNPLKHATFELSHCMKNPSFLVDDGI